MASTRAFALALFFVAIFSFTSCNASPIEAPEVIHQENPSLQEIHSLGLHNIIDLIKRSLDRFINKLVDDTQRNFPHLRQAIEDFERAVKDFRLHKLTHAALMKTLSSFTKGLFQVREQLVAMEKLSSVVRWMDERVKGLCYLLSLYKEDCGYPDIDTVGTL